MKKLYLIFVMSVIMMSTYAQNSSTERAKADFNLRMETYINSQLANPAIMTSAKQLYGHTCDKNHIVTADEIKARVSETERGNFIQANLAEYMRLYFPQNSHRGITSDTLICDNGGFEDDFLYYRGYTSIYTTGSDSCRPYNSGSPISWTPVTMPVTNRFEIMTTGIDPLVGIQKVKFGNKSLRINNKYGHGSQCDGIFGIDRVTKRFKVTKENRHFTLWYAVALENPPGHMDQQPFLNIKCDKAPADELCFDADLIKCENNYTDPNCSFDKIDVLDWACHRFTIPPSEIGTIATVEMIVADCGAGAHFGYAYIDGFCEECAGSSLGSINLEGSLTDPTIGIDYFSCDGLTARVCGRFTYPTLCGIWGVDAITVPGHTIQNLSINALNNTFCFDFPIENFGIDTCLDITAQIKFSSSVGMNLPPQMSNTIKICRDLYESYDYDVMVSNCNNNGTNYNLSDDYYFVTVDIDAPNSGAWSVRRKLDNPYPGESGEYTITTGAGSTTLTLGPFLIQEGCWDIIIDLPTCSFVENICPPEYCSKCNEFAGLKISNIQCIPGITDTWSFDVFVPGTGSYTIKYDLGGTPSTIYCTKGTTCSISGGTILAGCKTFVMTSSICKEGVSITVCPPRPCSLVNCQIEAYLGTISCLWNGSFYVKLHTNPDSGLCYTEDIMSLGMMIPLSGIIGSFSASTSVMIYDCSKPGCYKWIHIPKLGCGDNVIDSSNGRSTVQGKEAELTIVPNPIYGDRLTIQSDMASTVYGIFNTMGQYITSGQFTGKEANILFDHPAGLYIIKYKNADGEDKYSKFIKR